MTPVELFNKDWCHPVAAEIKSGQAIMKCSKNDKANCAKDCQWGSLKDMLPKGEFCGVDVKLPYPETITQCMEFDKAGCAKIGTCEWYVPDGYVPPKDEKCSLKCEEQANAENSKVAGSTNVCQDIPKDRCSNVAQCRWETPTTPACPKPVKPSTDLNKCTHTKAFNYEKAMVDNCAKMDQTQCFTNMWTQYQSV
jgi:hypothetical protein